MLLLMLSSLLDDEQRETIEKIFREEKSFFFRVARGMLASKEDAEDAVSEALLKIVDNLDKISKLPRNKTRAYCITIVKNCAREKLRRDKRLVFSEEPEQYADEAGESTEDRYFKTLKATELQTLLSLLSEEEQRLLFLRYEERRSYKDIGGILQCTEDSARMRGFRIIEKLRKHMDEIIR
ncbi:MAG: sigma-70 family RNA polymerase sigma factor [Lachnospiraceae bacterium]|nr:sigma-70 family RNA polymerase sigma factor [Lachnospiraceae bacterium]